jgi:hypothetical protein
MRPPGKAAVFRYGQDKTHIRQVDADTCAFVRAEVSHWQFQIVKFNARRYDRVMNPYFLLSCAGFAAGAMNALAGGGSFVSLPALIAAGVPSLQANASSTVALFPGGLASAWAYRNGLTACVSPVPLRALLVATLFGGVCGALLLLYTPSKAFNAALPWLLLFAFLILAFGKRIGDRLRARFRIGRAVVLPVQFGLGIYGGYFGGAVGIMMIAMWGLLDGSEPKQLNGRRTLMVSTANLMAVIVFTVANAVYWRQTVVMLVSAVVGGYVGARAAGRISARATRWATLLITAAITGAFFARGWTAHAQ